MDRASLDLLLEAVAGGQVTPSEAAERIAALPVADLDFARIDFHRELRTGLPEAIFASGKTARQIHAIASVMLARPGGAVIATRATREQYEAVRDLEPVSWHEAPGTIVFRASAGSPIGSVAVVTGGTSDLPVAEEASACAEAFGAKVDRITDVGVAGVHRTLAVLDRLRDADVLIVAAGMEGALPSLIAGLVPAPVIAVPTSVGYGASYEGIAALLGMLNSCAPGIAVTNIDNGFGAAALAVRILRERA